MRHSIIALCAICLSSAAFAQAEADETLPSRQTEIHNHTEVTIARLSLRRLAAPPEAVPEAPMLVNADVGAELEEAGAWEDVVDEAGAPQVLETHTHLNVSWAAEECWAEFKAELSDGSADYKIVDSCNETQLQFGAQFDHE